MIRKRFIQFGILIVLFGLVLTGWSKINAVYQGKQDRKYQAERLEIVQAQDGIAPGNLPSATPTEIYRPEPAPTATLKINDSQDSHRDQIQETATGAVEAELISEIKAETLDQPPNRTYTVQQTLNIRNQGPGEISTLEITTAKIHSLEPFQEVTVFSVDPPLEYQTKFDQHGNEYLVFQLENIPEKGKQRITINYELTAHEQKTAEQECEGVLIQDYTHPEEFIESDSPEISTLASKLSKDAENACQQSRAFYDYVTGTMAYTAHTAESHGALYALNHRAGDCTEFADLLIALNRSTGIPARFVEGVTPLAGDEGHDWAQVYLPGSGWTTMDATWGRLIDNRETYFAGTTPDHIIVTIGRNLEELNNFHYWTYSYTWPKNCTQPVLNARMDWDVEPAATR